MYTVYLINFGWELETVFYTLEEAVAKAESSGFECAIRKDGQIIKVTKPFEEVK